MTQLLLFGVESQKQQLGRNNLTSPLNNVTFATDRDSDKDLIVLLLVALGGALCLSQSPSNLLNVYMYHLNFEEQFFTGP